MKNTPSRTEHVGLPGTPGTPDGGGRERAEKQRKRRWWLRKTESGSRLDGIPLIASCSNMQQQQQ